MRKWRDVVSMTFQNCRADSICLENWAWIYDHVDDSKDQTQGTLY